MSAITSSGIRSVTDTIGRSFARIEKYLRSLLERNAVLPGIQFVIDGVFDSAAAGGVIIHAATGLDEQAFAAVQKRVRGRLLRAFVRRGLLPDDAARASGRLSDARRWQELAVAVRPQDADLIYNLALVCHQQADVSAASAYCRRALALAPDNPRVRSLGAILAKIPAAGH